MKMDLRTKYSHSHTSSTMLEYIFDGLVVCTDMTSDNGLIDPDESAGGILKAIEATDATVRFQFVDYKVCLIPW